MFGSLSKAELTKTSIDQIGPLQNHLISLIQPLVLPPGISFFSSFFFFLPDIPLLLSHLLHWEIIPHHLLGLKNPK